MPRGRPNNSIAGALARAAGSTLTEDVPGFLQGQADLKNQQTVSDINNRFKNRDFMAKQAIDQFNMQMQQLKFDEDVRQFEEEQSNVPEAKPLTGDAGFHQYLQSVDPEKAAEWLEALIASKGPKPPKEKPDPNNKETAFKELFSPGRPLPSQGALDSASTYLDTGQYPPDPPPTFTDRPFVPEWIDKLLGLSSEEGNGELGLGNQGIDPTFRGVGPQSEVSPGPVGDTLSTYQLALQWYNSPAGKADPERDAILENVRKEAGIR
jgi:hypothetical protein